MFFVSVSTNMATSRVAGGGYGLQVWREAANMLKNHSQTADERWSSSFRVGRGANNSSP